MKESSGWWSNFWKSVEGQKGEKRKKVSLWALLMAAGAVGRSGQRPGRQKRRAVGCRSFNRPGPALRGHLSHDR